MTAIPAGIAAETALLRQNVALAVVKQSAQQDKLLVNILDQAVRSVPASSNRGTALNIRA